MYQEFWYISTKTISRTRNSWYARWFWGICTKIMGTRISRTENTPVKNINLNKLGDCAPHVFLSLRTTQHDFGVRPSGVLIKRELWKPADARTYWEYASGLIPEPVRCSYRSYLLSEPEILATAKGSCAKMVPKRSQKSVVRPSVCPSVAFYSKLIPYLRKRK